MVERLTKERRSWNMSRIGGKNTKPELIVRSVLHKMGYRFRLHRKDLPGNPDIVLPRYNTIIFVHGCFWHQHPGCKLAYEVKHKSDNAKRKWWREKLEGNVARDKRNIKALKQLGMNVGIVWECQTHDRRKLALKLQKIIHKSKAYQEHIYAEACRLK